MNRFVSHSMALWTNSPTDVFEASYTSADRLADIGTLVESSGRLSVFQDTPDNRILECAVEGTADAIVTGDKAMLAIGGYEGIRLITLADYLDQSGRAGNGAVSGRRIRVAHLWRISTEAYGKFRKSTETIILAPLQLFDNTKDYGLLWEADGLRG